MISFVAQRFDHEKTPNRDDNVISCIHHLKHVKKIIYNFSMQDFEYFL